MRTETKHTPGPWTIEVWEYAMGNPPQRELAVQTESNRIAVIDWDQGQDNPYTIKDNEARSNALLIAAAPELLEAAKRALGLIRDTWNMEHGNPQVGKVWGALETAIAKATQDNP
jgi:ribosomal protein S18 acetylase RimI-like enzyme